MGEVAPLVESHRENRVARFQQRLIDRHIGVRPAMGLYVGVVGAEQGGQATSREVLDLVNDLVTAVVATPGIPLGVLIGEDRTGGGEHGRRREVLAGDQLKGRGLALPLLGQERRHFVVVRNPDVKG